MIRSRDWVLFGTVALLGLTNACTNSDDLSSGNGLVSVEVELANPTSRFADAGIFLAQLTVQPTDPDAQEVSNTIPIGLLALQQPLDINFNASTQTFQVSGTLPEGVYRVESLLLFDPIFEDATSASPNSCAEFISAYPRLVTPNPFLRLTNFGREVLINAPPNGQVSLRVRIDGAALLAAYQAAWTCRANCFAPGVPPRIVPWCISPFTDNQFNRGSFSNLAPTFIEFL